MADAATVLLALLSGLFGGLLGATLPPWIAHRLARPRLRVRLLYRGGAQATFEAVNEGRTATGAVRAWCVGKPLGQQREQRDEGRFYPAVGGLSHSQGSAYPNGDIQEVEVPGYARREFRIYFPLLTFCAPDDAGIVGEMFLQDATGRVHKLVATGEDPAHKNESSAERRARAREVAGTKARGRKE